MARLALLIGSQTDGLFAVGNDVQAIAGVLDKFGFCCEIRQATDASRAGIVDGYEALIGRAREDDAVVFYFTGHGARAANPGYDRNNPLGGPAWFQFIVPTDIYDSTDSDFCGITNHELSCYLSQLTQRTRNVTVILDCCHAALMSRSLDRFTPKALTGAWFAGIRSHTRRLGQLGIDISSDVEGNPHAVGVVACGPQQSAYEYVAANGRRASILTESLCLALDEAADLENVDWRAIGTRIRSRCQAVFAAQRPLIEGPASRTLFGLADARCGGMLQIATVGDEPILHGGRLLDVREGDQYRILPPGASDAHSAQPIATATVTAVHGSTSQLRVDYLGDLRQLPTGAMAYSTQRAGARMPIALEGPPAPVASLRALLDDSPWLRCVTDGQDEAFVRVLVDDDGITVCDAAKTPLYETKPMTQEGIGRTVDNLRVLQQAQAMRDLTNPFGAARLDAATSIEWGRVDENGQAEVLPWQSAVINCGDRVFVSIRNLGSTPLWIAILNVGLSGARQFVNEFLAPHGVCLDPLDGGRDDYVYGRKKGVLKGYPVNWPDGVPRTVARPESFVVFVLDRPADLRELSGSGMRSKQASLTNSPLHRELMQIATAEPQAVARQAEAPDLRYDIHHIGFFVEPTTPGSTTLKAAIKSIT